MAQENLASKNDIANLVKKKQKKTDFDDKIKNLNQYVTSNKTKHILVENELHELSKKDKAISTKGLMRDFINGYKILNDVWGIFKNYLKFIPSKMYIRYFSGTTQINLWKFNGMKYWEYN